MLRLLYTVFCCSALLTATGVYGQSRLIDSLNRVLPASTDTQRVHVLNKLSSAYWYLDPLKTIGYARQAVNLAEDLHFDRGLATGYNNVGVGYYQQNRYDSAIAWYQKALEVHRRTGNFKGEGYVYSNIGLIYWKQGLLTQSVEYYLKSLKIWEKHQLETETAGVFDNLGNVYNEQEDYDRALQNYFKAVAIQRKYNRPPQEQSMTLSNIGTAYLGKQQPKVALPYFFESLKLLEDDDIESRAVSLSNIGLTYVDLKNYANASAYLGQALQLQEQTGDNDGIVHTLLGLAKTSHAKKDYQTAKQYGSRALSISQQINDNAVIEEVWLLLSEVSAAQNDYRNAYHYYQHYVSARDSIRNKENIFKIAHLQANIETQKKQVEIESLRKEKQQQAFRRNMLAAGLIALLIIAALVVSRQRLKIRQHQQLKVINARLIEQSRQLEEQTHKLRELDHVKSTFFANISHEFRTPLTLILNSLSDRISQAKSAKDADGQEPLEVMYRNAKRLLQLINQLLDLSKLDAGHMKLSPQPCDLGKLLSIVHASFSSLSQSRQITFTLDLPAEPMHMMMDADKVEKILYNLLSNAFKFTPVQGVIQLKAVLSDQDVRIEVRDSGHGIPEEQLSQVFNRFYQGKQYYSDEQGTGIGLALTKELVELHGGKIWAENENPGAAFIFTLPFVPAETVPEDLASAVKSEELMEPSLVVQIPAEALDNALTKDRPSVLVVEDNDDLRQYIKKHLSAEYEVIETENGKKGLEAAIALIPDIIISDWMMPEMDGIALCERLKSDERTSHIPVIILTALATSDARFQGLKTGADDYLTKPFDNLELHIRIRNLIENRKRLRERFSKELLLGPRKVPVTSMDEKFLEKVMDTIETFMGDPDFNMEKFGQEVGLSRMQLHRKLKALTGESPGDFFRSMRLQRARKLLEAKAGNVSEIAYQVGFNNLSYFSKCYREQFNMAPNETFSGAVTQVSGNVTG